MSPPAMKNGETTTDNNNILVISRNNNNNSNSNSNHVLKQLRNNGNIAALTPTITNCSRRYAEIGQWKNRGDAFLEPYMQGLGAELSTSTSLVSKQLQHTTTTQQEHDNHQHRIADSLTAQFRIIPDITDHPRPRPPPHQESCESSGASSGDSSASGDEDGGGDEEAPCDIGLLERLIRSHPVWFLPGIQRAGAFHLLQGKEDGNFVVRQSSQTCTMAISVRLPAGKGPYIEHYLIQAADDGQLSLESSDNKFESIPALIAHYAQCCDELPVQLTLPRAIREAKNRQQLSSLALLGQEFWRYPMANPRPALDPHPPPRGPGEVVGGLASSLPSSASNSQASSLSSFGSGNNNVCVSPTMEQDCRNDSIVLNLAPLEASPSPSPQQPPSIMSTFKGPASNSPAASEHVGSPSPPSRSPPSTHTVSFPSRAPRPTPPNTLNLICSTLAGARSSSNSPLQQLVAVSNKTPPPPPPRWAKPSPSPHQNITVTTTVTFSMSQETTPPSHVEVSCVQVTPKIVNLEPENFPSLSSTSTLESRTGREVPEPAPRTQLISPAASSVTSPSPSSLTSPTTSTAVTSPTQSRPPHRRSKRHKESRHYQESDILESPTVYYRSSVADKVSDYEDIWGPESLSTFKPVRSSPFSSPDENRAPVPDILERVPPTVPATGTTTSAISGSSGTGSGPRNRLGLSVNTTTPLSPTAVTELKTPDSQPTSNGKQGSPFYAEPADAIRQAALLKVQRRQVKVHSSSKSHRQSDPLPLIQWPNPTPASGLERIDSKEELNTSGSGAGAGLSSSVDNLAQLRQNRHRVRAKPVQPPRVGFRAFHDTSWTVDSSWEFIGNEEGGSDGDQESQEERFVMERRFPSLEQQAEDAESMSPHGRGVTIHEIIAQRFPSLRLSPNLSSCHRGDSGGRTDFNNGSRVSAYDNVVNNNHKPVSICLNGSGNSDNDDALTVFSEPWDSSRWEHLLRGRDRDGEQSPGDQPSLTSSTGPRAATTPTSTATTVTRTKSFKERLDPLLSPPRLQALQRGREAGGGGASIRAYALHLAADKSTTFAQNIDNFIACTRESRETKPQVVMRNMRQFMSGMKNYLVKHGEREFEKEVDRERGKLKANEFLNLDAILEGVMHKLVVRPLKEHLYHLFVEEYSNNGAIALLADNIILARTKPLLELGIRKNIIPPSEESLATICHYLHRLQEVDSPLEKLENLLTAISAIFNSVKVNSSSGGKGLMLGADDFLPLFVWVLVQSGMIAAEIEAEYMWGLLHPSLLSGEGGYYLTTLSSAVHVLKNFKACTNSEPNLDWGSGPMSEFRSVLKIVVPDEMNGSIITKTLPVRPNMTTRDVCKIIAHKVRITNPQDYGLYKLVDGEETLLGETDCPQDIKGAVSTIGKHCMFAYKRIDAKIAWPRTTSPE